MSKNIVDALKAAAIALEGSGHEDEIFSLLDMFAPRDGDPEEQALCRDLAQVECGNCHLTWPAMAMPSPVKDASLTALRLAKCPRCFETKRVFLKSKK